MTSPALNTILCRQISRRNIRSFKYSGSAVKKKNDTHRMAEANKAFAISAGDYETYTLILFYSYTLKYVPLHRSQKSPLRREGVDLFGKGHKLRRATQPRVFTVPKASVAARPIWYPTAGKAENSANLWYNRGTISRVL